MYQPDPRQPFPPAAPQQYAQPPVYQPYAPAPPPQYPSPPPKPRMSPKKIVAIVAVVVVVILMTTIGLGGILIVHFRSQSQQGGNVERPLTMELESYFPASTVNGTQWVVEITNGSKDPASTRLQIFDPNTGAVTVDKTVQGFSDLDGQYQDGPVTGKLDKGDRIWISGNGGHVQHGSKVQLVVGTSVVAGPLTLP